MRCDCQANIIIIIICKKLYIGGAPIYKEMAPGHETSEPPYVMFVLVVYKTLPFPLT